MTETSQDLDEALRRVYVRTCLRRCVTRSAGSVLARMARNDWYCLIATPGHIVVSSKLLSR